jgi:hypothetical protein
MKNKEVAKLLNIYFVFGVPIFLLILYLFFAYLRKKKNIHYLGFILLIIAGFMLVFNLQTWQQAVTEMDHLTAQEVSQQVGYPIYLIWVPILIAACLVLLNLYRGVRRVLAMRKK